MIEIKDFEKFKENANKIIAYLDNGENFYMIRQKEPELIKWYRIYGLLEGHVNKEANDLLTEIFIKRRQLSRQETAQRKEEIKKQKEQDAQSKQKSNKRQKSKKTNKTDDSQIINNI